MLIALTTDEATIQSIRRLKALYPNEIALRMTQIIHEGIPYDLSGITENPIRRITILGHAHANVYAGMNAHEFAEHVYQMIQINEEKTPGFKKNLRAIDLLGCEVGFVNQQEQGFALQVAQYLRTKECSITVNAFTNQEPVNQPLQHTLLQKTTKETQAPTVWEFLGFKTKENKAIYKDLFYHKKEQKNLRDHATAKLYELIEAEQILKTANTELETSITHFRTQIKIKKDQAKKPEEKQRYKELLSQGKQELQKRQAEIRQNKEEIRRLHQAQAEVSTEIERLEHKITTIQTQQDACSIRINQTDNPREYFDQHPECNFTRIAKQKIKSTPVQIARAYKTHVQLERKQISNDQHPLHPHSHRGTHH